MKESLEGFETLCFSLGFIALDSPAMTKHFSYLAVAVVTAFLVSCSGNTPVSSGTNLVPAESLSSYETFGWSKNRFLNLLDQDRNTAEAKAWVDSSIELGFNDKGLNRTEASSADVLVSYSVGSRSIHSAQTFSEDSELGQNRRQEMIGSGRSGTLHSDYQQGRIYLTVTDRESGKVVYRATSEAALLDQPSERKSRSRLQTAVKDMLGNWPKR